MTLLQAAVYAQMFHCLPRRQQLVNVVLMIFEQFERPHVETQIQIVCARYGWLFVFDGSGAPLQETKSFLPALKVIGKCIGRKLCRGHRQGIG